MAIEPKLIDYRKLSAGLDYYTSHGYEYLEVPWIVPHRATAVTLPKNRVATTTRIGDLVGSGEQSFIELMMRGQQIKKACCITPCFRDEEVYDELHHAYFIKLELINTAATDKNLHTMIKDAKTFLETFTPVAIVETGTDMYDIVDQRNGIELGSYGYREFDGHRFIYGTGIALPRLDTAIAIQT